MADHASRLVAELIGEAFIAAVERSGHRSVERARAAWRWVRDVAEAPPGLELVSPDGTRYTGLVIVERSRAIYVLALRHAGRADPNPHTRHFDEPPFSHRGADPYRDRDGGWFPR